MSSYRLYYLDPAGHFARAEEFEADGDLDAIAAAITRGGETPTELWCEGRKVIRAGETPAPARITRIV